MELNMEERFAKQRGHKKNVHKTSLFQTKEKICKSKNVKKLSKYKKGFEDFDDMDSLSFLKDMTESKKLNEIDERIKLLKKELKSLLDDKKSDQDCDFFADKSDLICTDLINSDKISEAAPNILNSHHKNSLEFCKESSIISSAKDFKHNISPIPSKFSVWLDKTIDEMDSKPEAEDKILPNINSTPLNSKLQLACSETTPSLASDFKSNFFNISLLPQHQVEKLLYKSLVMQNSEVYLSSSEDSDKEHIKSTGKINQQKCRSKKQCRKSHKERLAQSNLNKNCRFSQKGRKRRKINRNSFQKEVEVIDLVCGLGNKEMPKTNYEVLDVDNYDWNEPFDLNEDIGFPSDVEITDNFKKNNVKLNDLNLKVNDTVIIESDRSVCYNEGNKAQQKKVWECPVCFEQSKGQEVVATQCGHIFCKNCIENHSSKLGESCPSCRSDLKDKPLITLFNF